MMNFPSAGIPTMPIAHLKRYIIGFANPDGSRTTTEVEARSLYAAEEAAVEYRNMNVEIFAEEIEEYEELDRPITI